MIRLALELKWILGLLAFIYEQISFWRRFFYDRGWLKSYSISRSSSSFSKAKAKVKVISVGNLSMGGTGKTPFVLFLGQELRRRGYAFGVVARNYRAPKIFKKNAKAWLVDPSDSLGSLIYGDEPMVLANRLSPSPVMVGPKKWKSAQALVEQFPELQVVLLDDGFQHLKLKKDFNIVLIDFTDPSAFEVFPMGTGREGLRALEAADWLIGTKANWAKPYEEELVKSQLPKGKPFSLVNYLLSWPDHLEIKENQKIFAVCGVAQPRPFLSEIEKKWPNKIFLKWVLKDHHPYTDQELRKIEAVMSDEDLILITTEKDFVKLSGRLSKRIAPRVFFAQVMVQFRNEKDPFFDRLNQLLDL
jgi:tetraacyldisaccharide 4'-kinase